MSDPEQAPGPRPAPPGQPLRPAHVAEPDDPCQACPMRDGLHQYWCPTLPEYSASPEHLWIVFSTSLGASCRWCGRMATERSRETPCPGRVRIEMR